LQCTHQLFQHQQMMIFCNIDLHLFYLVDKEMIM
jgi:hypothetical protein